MYTYNDLLSDVQKLKNMGAEVFNIGKTVLGRPIPCVHIGSKTGSQIIIQGAIHAREHITAAIVVRQAFSSRSLFEKGKLAFNFSKRRRRQIGILPRSKLRKPPHGGGSRALPWGLIPIYFLESSLPSQTLKPSSPYALQNSPPEEGCPRNEGGVVEKNSSSVRSGKRRNNHPVASRHPASGGEFSKGGAYFIPMVNIDGVMLCQEGISSVCNKRRRAFLLKCNNGSENFAYWKANANAVDLNCNFDAQWGTGEQNLARPAPANCIGKRPHSEPEVRALINLTKAVRPALTISYHATGQEIYWEFFQEGERRNRDKNIALAFAAETGYTLKENLKSAGGYKDWCIQHLKIPAFTFETTPDATVHPIDYACLEEEFERNKNVPILALELLKNFATK